MQLSYQSLRLPPNCHIIFLYHKPTIIGPMAHGQTFLLMIQFTLVYNQVLCLEIMIINSTTITKDKLVDLHQFVSWELTTVISMFIYL